MTLDTLLKEDRLCPFGITMKNCQYQETYTKDIETAIKGDLAFICTLDPKRECFKIEEMLKLWE